MKHLKTRLNTRILFRNSMACAAILSLAAITGHASEIEDEASIDRSAPSQAGVEECHLAADADESVCMLVPRRTRLIIKFQRVILA
ncbi:MAG: hypothetical protein EA376_07885 [Phycisphaeraceae bacterium]|nr:MAG: hypothetical protein EA376_07885 [Phycisphaeraceae bacterium]